VPDHQRLFALIIASDYYTDKKLTQLKAPTVDAKKLGDLLKDPTLGGGYDVKILANEESYIITREIETFFADRQKDDLLLLYFAGHGHKGPTDGRLYLATKDSDLKKLRSTTIPAEFIKSSIQDSRSSKIVIILDCCYSGAFGRGWASRDDKTVHVKDEFREIESRDKESGCVVLTSATAMQYSFENDILKKEGTSEPSSFYTDLLIKGIESREADLNGDSIITCGELNDYIKNKLKELSHPQNPEIYLLKGDVSIAQGKKLVVKTDPSISSFTSWDQRIAHIQKLLQNSQVYDFNNLRNNDNQPIHLPKIDLSGKNLQTIDLHGAILNESVLRKTKLNSANLRETTFTNADLTEADLRSSDLYGAKLNGTKLVNAKLRGADLKGMIDFSNADLTGADLRGVDLDGMVNFQGAILNNTDFTGSYIDKVILNLKDVDIKNVKGLIITTGLSNPYKSGEEATARMANISIEEAATRIANNIVEEKSDKLKQGVGRCLLASSQGYQEAYNRQEKNHSIFTYYLLEGLKGHKNAVDDEGNVTYDTLGKFINREIGNLPLEKRPKQTPIRKGEVSGGEIILANYPHLRKIKESTYSKIIGREEQYLPHQINNSNHSKNNKKALVIAVSDYDNSSNFKSLEFGNNNGQEMYNILKKIGYDIPDNRKLIGYVDSQSLREAIYDFFTNEDNKSDYTLVLYYSGHGITDKWGKTFLAPSDSDSDHPYLKGFSFDDLTNSMLLSNSQCIVTILDIFLSSSLKIISK
jgi:uncharacterized protein YjbI with pentapeptide repeats